jgi:hypothetical protein
LMKVSAVFAFLFLLASRAMAVSVCDVQAYDPLTGYSPYNGATVTVTGVITAPAGIFTPSQTSMYLRGLGNDVCGVNIFAFGQTGNVGLGDTVRVTGTVEEYVSSGGSGASTEIIFTQADLVRLGEASVPYVEPVEMRTGEVGKEENEGKLIKVTGKVVGKSPPEEVILDDGSGTISIYDFAGVMAGDSTWQDLKWGDEVSISGIVTQYDPSLPYLSDYQVWPRGPNPPFDDISIPQCIPDTVTAGAVLEIRDASGRETALFCPDCPGSGGRITIKYNGPDGSRLRLRIFDCYGREVADLNDNCVHCGSRVFEWDGRNELLESLPMGLYHVVVTASDPVSGEVTQTSAPIVIGRRLK